MKSTSDTLMYHTINRAAFVCLSVCLFVPLSPPRSFDRSSPNLVGVCRWTSELPLRGSFSKRSTGRRVNGSLSLSTILYICQPHSTQLQKATLLLQHLIRLKGTFCCIDGWWVYLGGSRNCLLDGSSMACNFNALMALRIAFQPGVFCAIVSHPADTIVSKLNQDKSATVMGIARNLGWSGKEKLNFVLFNYTFSVVYAHTLFCDCKSPDHTLGST